ncbi:hypothetical protein MBM_09660 [Drepanopeziza brunnea f. sp. 'multigermtubi' MB_m1]|uniref:Uncharacterized protein n=1 Tax=Marssonina brunnea f. sp. multigermtubi (strain MB_m1) TaxID=1072389 RepID=K1WH97_MARBU|nr:uncharacterized protein MBM_09660 [Drepanopeziza brunnea f. sp. 'multigermtubi' MB_m1]EKD12161.1 hypothetical protein MBM_09660 [Drepanopeziza brunnea f. sp. 'multigermtubi' MB_m1]
MPSGLRDCTRDLPIAHRQVSGRDGRHVLTPPAAPGGLGSDQVKQHEHPARSGTGEASSPVSTTAGIHMPAHGSGEEEVEWEQELAVDHDGTWEVLDAHVGPGF